MANDRGSSGKTITFFGQKFPVLPTTRTSSAPKPGDVDFVGPVRPPAPTYDPTFIGPVRPPAPSYTPPPTYNVPITRPTWNDAGASSPRYTPPSDEAIAPPELPTYRVQSTRQRTAAERAQPMPPDLSTMSSMQQANQYSPPVIETTTEAPRVPGLRNAAMVPPLVQSAAPLFDLAGEALGALPGLLGNAGRAAVQSAAQSKAGEFVLDRLGRIPAADEQRPTNLAGEWQRARATGSPISGGLYLAQRPFEVTTEKPIAAAWTSSQIANASPEMQRLQAEDARLAARLTGLANDAAGYRERATIANQRRKLATEMNRLRTETWTERGLTNVTPEEQGVYRTNASMGLQFITGALYDPLNILDFIGDSARAARLVRQADELTGPAKALRNPYQRAVAAITRTGPQRVLTLDEVAQETVNAVEKANSWLGRMTPWQTTPESMAHAHVNQAADSITRMSEAFRDAATNEPQLAAKFAQAGDEPLTGMFKAWLADPDDADIVRLTGGYSQSRESKRTVILVRKLLGTTDEATAGKALDALKAADAKVARATNLFDAAKTKLDNLVKNPKAPAAKVTAARQAVDKAQQFVTEATDEAARLRRTTTKVGDINFPMLEKILKEAGDDDLKAVADLARGYEDAARQIYARPVTKQVGGLDVTEYKYKSNAAKKVRGQISNVVSTMYLGTNPGYAFRNAANNLFTAVVDGVSPVQSADSIRALWTKWGPPPWATKKGVGAQGDIWKSRQKAQDYITGISTPMRLRDVFKAIETASVGDKLSVTLQLGQNFERYASERIVAHHIRNFWQQVWPKTVKRLTGNLEAQGFTRAQVNVLRSRLDPCMNPQDVRRTIEDFISGTPPATQAKPKRGAPGPVAPAPVRPAPTPQDANLHIPPEIADEVVRQAGPEALDDIVEIVNSSKTSQEAAARIAVVEAGSDAHAAVSTAIAEVHNAGQDLLTNGTAKTKDDLLAWLNQAVDLVKQAQDADIELVAGTLRQLDDVTDQAIKDAVWKETRRVRRLNRISVLSELNNLDASLMPELGFDNAAITSAKNYRLKVADTWDQSDRLIDNFWRDKRNGLKGATASKVYELVMRERARLFDDLAKSRNLHVIEFDEQVERAVANLNKGLGGAAPAPTAPRTPSTPQPSPAAAVSLTGERAMPTDAGMLPELGGPELPAGAPTSGTVRYVEPDRPPMRGPGYDGNDIRAAAREAGISTTDAKGNVPNDKWLLNFARKNAGVDVERIADMTDDQRTAVMDALQRRARRQAELRVEPKAPPPPRPVRVPGPTVMGRQTHAYGIDAAQPYNLRFKAVDLDDLVVSHDDAFRVNPEFPSELQPRDRTAQVSKSQVDEIVAKFNPDWLLVDHQFVEDGPMVVTKGNVVLAGNGRTLALRYIRDREPQKWAAYQAKLRQSAGEFGLDTTELAGMKTPILVRELDEEGIDLVKFARESNDKRQLAASAAEDAINDVERISDARIAYLAIGDNQSIDGALLAPSNIGVVNEFINSFPVAQRGSLIDKEGNLSAAGRERLKNALLAKTFKSDIGKQLAAIFIDSADPQVKTIEAGVYGALGKLAKMESSIRSGAKAAEFSLEEDLAAAIEMLARLRQQGFTVREYLHPDEVGTLVAMHESELTELQEKLLAHLDYISRRQKMAREFLSEYADTVMGETPNMQQMDMFGGIELPTDKEGILDDIITRQQKQIADEYAGRGTTAEVPVTPRDRPVEAGFREPDLAETGAPRTEAGAGQEPVTAPPVVTEPPTAATGPTDLNTLVAKRIEFTRGGETRTGKAQRVDVQGKLVVNTDDGKFPYVERIDTYELKRVLPSEPTAAPEAPRIELPTLTAAPEPEMLRSIPGRNKFEDAGTWWTFEGVVDGRPRFVEAHGDRMEYPDVATFERVYGIKIDPTEYAPTTEMPNIDREAARNLTKDRGAKLPDKPKVAAAPEPEPSTWRKVGTNREGLPLYEDQNGVRSYVRDNVRVTEPVEMVVTRTGVEAVYDHSSWTRRDYLLPDEYANMRGTPEGWVDNSEWGRKQKPEAPAPKPAQTEREQLIQRIVDKARDKQPEIVQRSLVKGDNGEWYLPGNYPVGVKPTNETKTYWTKLSSEGSTYGTRHSTREEALAEWQSVQDKNAAQFYRVLSEGSDERLRAQAEYWLKEKPPTPSVQAKPVATPPAMYGPDPADDVATSKVWTTDDRGRMILPISRETGYDELPESVRAEIRRYFIFSPKQKAWLSKGQASGSNYQGIAKRAGFMSETDARDAARAATADAPVVPAMPTSMVDDVVEEAAPVLAPLTPGETEFLDDYRKLMQTAQTAGYGTAEDWFETLPDSTKVRLIELTKRSETTVREMWDNAIAARGAELRGVPVTKSFKVEMKERGGGWAGANGLRFATEEEARAYADDLLSRWTGAEDFRALPTNEPVNSTWKAGEGLGKPDMAPPPQAAPTVPDPSAIGKILERQTTEQLRGSYERARAAYAKGLDLNGDVLDDTTRADAERAIGYYEAEFARRGIKLAEPQNPAGAIMEAGGTEDVTRRAGTSGAATEETRVDDLGVRDRGTLEGVPAEEVRPPEGIGAASEGDLRRPGMDEERARSGDQRPGDEVRRGLGDAEGGTGVPASGGIRAGETAAQPAPAPSYSAEGPRSTTAPDKPGRDYVIRDSDGVGEGGKKGKASANIEAIRLLKQLESEGRLATPAEQAILVKYAGWGGIKEAFDRRKAFLPEEWDSLTRRYVSRPGEWHKEYNALKELLTDAEYSRAFDSTLNAHFTSLPVIDAMWAGLRRLGFKGGNMLEPAGGIGHFFGRQPADLASKSKRVLIELDPTTAAIAKHLYQNANTYAMGYQDAPLPRNWFNLAVSNVPFAEHGVSDPWFNRSAKYLTKHIHDYYFAKTLEVVKPGGVIAFITSKGTMDKIDDQMRRYISERADLLMAVRLPEDAFTKNAGATVTTDIIFLRKRLPGELPNGESWTELREVLDPSGQLMPVNEYYQRHPENILGQMQWRASGRYGDARETAVLSREGDDLAALLNERMNILPENVMVDDVVSPSTAHATGHKATLAQQDGYREGKRTVSDGRVHVNRAGRVVDITDDIGGNVPRVKGMVEIRDAAEDVRRLMLEDKPDAEIKAAQKKLNAAYDKFTKRFGFLNSKANVAALSDDPDLPNLLALEDWNRITKQATKMDLFNGRPIRPAVEITSVNSAKDALVASLIQRGRPDMDYMAKLYGKPTDEIATELTGRLFKNPEGDWELSDTYLAGNVRAKLKAAQAAAELDPLYQANVDSLLKVQPQEIPIASYSENDFMLNIGDPSNPPDVIARFIKETLDYNVGVRYSGAVGSWQLAATSGYSNYNEAIMRQKWGTAYADAIELLSDAMNSKQTTVRIPGVDADGRRTMVYSAEETLAAREKQEQLLAEWGRWWRETPGVREQMTEMYNDRYNFYTSPVFDGTHLMQEGALPGLTATYKGKPFEWRKYQADAIWRIITQGNTLLAHVVGAGKTNTMIAAGMELRRLGIAKKPVYVVPNHLVKQWNKDFIALYPGAKVLAATSENFDAAHRKVFTSQMATGDWDAIIIGHDSFKRLPVSREAEAAFIQEQINTLAEWLDENASRTARGGYSGSVRQASQTRKNDPNVRQVANQKKKLEEKLKKLLDQPRDDNITFEETGIDQIFVDEGHKYKNLWYNSSLGNVKGLGAREGNDLTTDMFIKIQQVVRRNNGRGVVFATGTPVSNSMVELYNIMRYMQYDTLQEAGLKHFDAWQRAFGRVQTTLEATVTGGYKMTPRLRKFNNYAGLRNFIDQFSDILAYKDITPPLPRPKILGDAPQGITIEPSNALTEFVQSLQVRATKLTPQTKKQDNMLKITGEAKMAALDMRLVDPSAPDLPGSKLNIAADNILRIYKGSHKYQGTQLVFCDISTPKAKKSDGFSAYDELRDKLIARGVPREQIAFIHSAKNDKAKDALFEAVRDGQIRVLIGSTDKMGAGTNVQDRMAAIHHLDVPWRASDVEQRNGRLLRPGNMHIGAEDGYFGPDGKPVEVLQYVSKGSLDEFLWQLVEAKARVASEIMSRNFRGMTVEVEDDIVLSAAQMRAIASGRPEVMEKIKVEADLVKLQSLRTTHYYEQAETRKQVEVGIPGNLERARQNIATYQKLIDEREAALGGKGFHATVGGKVIGLDSKAPYKDVGTAILEVWNAKFKPIQDLWEDLDKKYRAAKQAAWESGDKGLWAKTDFPRREYEAAVRQMGGFDRNVGTYAGLNIVVDGSSTYPERGPVWHIYLQNPKTGKSTMPTVLSFDPSSVGTSLRDLSTWPDREIQFEQAFIQKLEKELKVLKGEVGKLFAKEDDYQRLSKRNAELEAILNPDKKQNIADDLAGDLDDGEEAADLDFDRPTRGGIGITAPGTPQAQEVLNRILGRHGMDVNDANIISAQGMRPPYAALRDLWARLPEYLPAVTPEQAAILRKQAQEVLNRILGRHGMDVNDANIISAQGMRPLYAALRDLWARPPEYLPAVTPEQAAILRKLAQEGLLPNMVKNKAMVNNLATNARNFALGDYQNKRNIHEALAYVFPWSYWYTFTYPNWAQRLATHPSWVAKYARYREVLAKTNQDYYREQMGDPNAVMPEYWEDQVRVPFFGTQLYFDLERTLLPMQALLNDFNSRTRNDAPGPFNIGKGSDVNNLQEWGPSLWPPLIWAYAAWLSANGHKDAAEEWVGYVLPPSRAIKGATALLREAGVPGVPAGGVNPEFWNPMTQGGDTWERRRIGFELYNLYRAGKIDERQFQDAAYNQSGEAWDMARQAEAVKRAPGNIASYMLGAGFKARNADDIEIDKLNREWAAIWDARYNKGVTEDVWRGMLAEYNKKYPMGSAVRMAKEKDPTERLKDYGYMVFDRLPPGAQRYDALREAGLTDELISRFYADKGDTSKWQPYEVKALQAGIEKLAALVNVPDAATRTEYTDAKSAKTAIDEQAAKAVGQPLATLQATESQYFDIKDAQGADAARAFLAQHPELKKYWDAKNAAEQNAPDAYNKYYNQPTTTGATGTSGAATPAADPEKVALAKKYDEADKKFGPQVAGWADERSAIPKGPARDAWDKANPEKLAALRPYWDYIYGDTRTSSSTGTSYGGTSSQVQVPSAADQAGYDAARKVKTDIDAAAAKQAGISVDDALRLQNEYYAIKARSAEDAKAHLNANPALKKFWDARSSIREKLTGPDAAAYQKYYNEQATSNTTGAPAKTGATAQTGTPTPAGDPEKVALAKKYDEADEKFGAQIAGWADERSAIPKGPARDAWDKANPEKLAALRPYWDYIYGDTRTSSSTGTSYGGTSYGGTSYGGTSSKSSTRAYASPGISSDYAPTYKPYDRSRSYGGGGRYGGGSSTPPQSMAPYVPPEAPAYERWTADDLDGIFEQERTEDAAFDTFVALRFGGNILQLAQQYATMSAEQRAAWIAKNQQLYARLLKFLAWLMQQSTIKSDYTRQLQSIPPNAPNVSNVPSAPQLIPQAPPI